MDYILLLIAAVPTNRDGSYGRFEEIVTSNCCGKSTFLVTSAEAKIGDENSHRRGFQVFPRVISPLQLRYENGLLFFEVRERVLLMLHETWECVTAEVYVSATLL